MNFGYALKQARLSAGLTQKQLGEKCGMADSAIRKYESGKIKPKIETLKKLADALNISPIELADFETATRIMAYDVDQINMHYGPETIQYYRMVKAFSALNDIGAEKAAVAVEDLSKVPEYRREDGAASRETTPTTSANK